MLRVNKTININGQSIVDEKVAMILNATINEDNPQDMMINYYQSDREAYKANREICRTDQTAFEDMVYALQDKMLGGTYNEAE